KVDSKGSSLLYSTFLGGAKDDLGYAIAVDSSGSAYVTGRTSSTDFPTTKGAYQTSAGGSDDAFVTKLDSKGSTLSYSTYLGGSQEDEGDGIGGNSSGNG